MEHSRHLAAEPDLSRRSVGVEHAEDALQENSAARRVRSCRSRSALECANVSWELCTITLYRPEELHILQSTA